MALIHREREDLMRYADACDPPSYPRLVDLCPECDCSPCQCEEDRALEEHDEGGEGG